MQAWRLSLFSGFSNAAAASRVHWELARHCCVQGTHLLPVSALTWKRGLQRVRLLDQRLERQEAAAKWGGGNAACEWGMRHLNAGCRCQLPCTAPRVLTEAHIAAQRLLPLCALAESRSCKDAHAHQPCPTPLTLRPTPPPGPSEALAGSPRRHGRRQVGAPRPAIAAAACAARGLVRRTRRGGACIRSTTGLARQRHGACRGSHVEWANHKKKRP
jgi:hypothetical protein